MPEGGAARARRSGLAMKGVRRRRKRRSRNLNAAAPVIYGPAQLRLFRAVRQLRKIAKAGSTYVDPEKRSAGDDMAAAAARRAVIAQWRKHREERKHNMERGFVLDLRNPDALPGELASVTEARRRLLASWNEQRRASMQAALGRSITGLE